MVAQEITGRLSGTLVSVTISLYQRFSPLRVLRLFSPPFICIFTFSILEANTELEVSSEQPTQIGLFSSPPAWFFFFIQRTKILSGER